MHILSPETDNCPSWISGRERMTVENISWSISTKVCCRPRRGLNPRPPLFARNITHNSDAAPDYNQMLCPRRMLYLICGTTQLNTYKHKHCVETKQEGPYSLTWVSLSLVYSKRLWFLFIGLCMFKICWKECFRMTGWGCWTEAWSHGALLLNRHVN